MKLLRSIFKRLLTASALATSLTISTAMFASPAHANAPSPRATASEPAADNVDLSAYEPGKWHKLAATDGDPRYISIAGLMRAETQTGAVFCKMQRADGWYSNFVDCSQRENLNRMQDAVYGVMMPSADDPNEMMAYDISANRRDRSLTRAIYDAHMQLVALVRTPKPRVILADNVAPIVPAPVIVPQDLSAPLNLLPERITVETLPPIRVATAKPARRAPAITVARNIPRPARRPTDRELFGQGTQVAAATPARRDVPRNAPAVGAPVIPAAGAATLQLAAAAAPADNGTIAVRASGADNAGTVAVADAAPVLQNAVLRTSPFAAETLQRAGLRTTPDASLKDLFAAANENVSPLQRLAQIRAQRKAGQVADRDHRFDAKDDFMAVAQNTSFDTVRGGGRPSEWVTPAGRNVEFEMFKDGRFGVAPALMAA